MAVVVNIISRWHDRELRRAEEELALFGKKAVSTQDSLAGSMIRTGSAMKRQGEIMSGYGRTLTKSVTVPVVAMAALSVKAAADFDKAMTESLAIMGKVGPGLRKEMEATARTVAKESTFSAKEAAEAYYFLASAGLSAKQSIAALPGVTAFAQAGAFDLQQATDLLTDAQSALGLSSKNAAKYLANQTRLSDVLVRANTVANASVLQFSEALTNKAAAALRGLGKSVEEGTAVLAVFADQGLKGKAAGQGLYMVLRDMQKAAQAQPEAWKKLGISVYDSAGNMRNVGDIVADMEGKFAGLSDKQTRARFSALGFAEKGLAPLLMLMGESDKIKTYQGELEKASGFTDKVAKKQLEAFSAKLKLMWHRITDVGISLGQYLLPPLERLVGHISRAVDWFGRLSPATQKTIGKFALAAAAVGPVLLVLGKLSSLLGGVLMTAGTFGATFAGAMEASTGRVKSFGMAMSASGLATAGWLLVVVAVVAAVVLLYTKCEWFRKAVHAVIGAVVKTFNWMKDRIADVVGWIGEHWRGLLDVLLFAAGPIGWVVRYIIKNWDKVAEVAGVVWGKVKAAFAKFWDWAGPTITAAVKLWWQKIKTTFNAIVAVGKRLWDKLEAALEWFWGWSEDFITTSLKTWWTIIKTTFEVIVAVFRVAWPVIVAVVKTAVKVVTKAIHTLRKIIAFVRGVWDAVSRVTRKVWDALIGFLAKVGGRVMSAIRSIGGVVKRIRDWFESAKQAAIDKMRAMIEWLGRLPGINNVVSVVKKVAKKIADAFGSLKSKIGDHWDKIVSTMGRAVNKIGGFVNKAFGWAGVKIPKVTWGGADRYARGGIVPGSRAAGDNIPILATAGERVLSLEQIRRLGGHDAIDAAIGAQHFAKGGIVGAVSGAFTRAWDKAQGIAGAVSAVLGKLSIPTIAAPLSGVLPAVMEKLTAKLKSVVGKVFTGGSNIIANARRFLGVPYLWGGTTPRGFDCSGFTQYVYRMSGINIPRVATAQAHDGGAWTKTPVPGDLAFFGNSRFLHHVGIYAGGGRMIHAPHSGDVVRYGAIHSDLFGYKHWGAGARLPRRGYDSGGWLPQGLSLAYNGTGAPERVGGPAVTIAAGAVQVRVDGSGLGPAQLTAAVKSGIDPALAQLAREIGRL